jgi:hypothetical protein
MKNLQKILTYLLTQGTFIACLYYGAYQGIPGFMNILSVIVWFVFIVYLLTCYNEDSQKSLYLSSKKVPVPYSVSILLGIGYIAVMVFFGHILLGSLYAVSVILYDYMKGKGKKLVEENQ